MRMAIALSTVLPAMPYSWVRARLEGMGRPGGRSPEWMRSRRMAASCRDIGISPSRSSSTRSSVGTKRYGPVTGCNCRHGQVPTGRVIAMRSDCVSGSPGPCSIASVVHPAPVHNFRPKLVGITVIAAAPDLKGLTEQPRDCFDNLGRDGYRQQANGCSA